MTPRVRNYIKAALAAWALFAAFLLFWEFRSHTGEMELLARREARASWQRDVLYRAWAASLIGSHVPVTEATPPNPYLADLPDRDVGTTPGERLPLIDPAYMTRKARDPGRERFGPVSHITSLRPINPANAPDPWERAALAAFEKGEAEVGSVEPIDGKPHMRLMRPLVIGPGCLKCHEAQGYKAGEVLGGISISIPMEPFFALWRTARWNDLLAVGLLWLVGSAIILGGGLRIGRYLDRVFKSEEALRSSSGALQALVNSSPLAIVTFDKDGSIGMWNPAAERMFGWRAEEVTGRPHPIVPEDKREEFREFREIALGGGTFTGRELRRLRKDGSHIDISVSTAPLRDAAGSITSVMSIITDISERKKAEDALRRSVERYRDLFENANDVIYTHDLAGDFTSINRAAERITGYTRHEEGKINIASVVAPEYLDIVASQMLARDDIEGSRTRYDMELIRKDGRRVALEVSSRIIYREGKPVGVQGIARDITDRKRAEEEKRTLERQVQQAQKLESLGVLAGGIAHDFNNILMVVLGHAEIALKEISPMSPARWNLTEITTAARRAADLSQQMLAYAGKASFSLERVGLRELVEEMAHLLRAAISKKAILNLDLERGLPPIEADPTQIRQIVMNLIINASEAIGDRSGVITVSLGATRCDKEYLRKTELHDGLAAGLYVHLEVTDTGGGMDAETSLRIFEPFFTTKFTGRGLGLAAVLGIVRSHKGAIKVHSEPGKGTTFKILFPALEAAADRARTADSSALSDWGGKGTILLVDDEESLLALGARMLEHLGFTVLTAADGRKAVELYRERGKEIGLVLMDLTMPHMDGVEAFGELRRLNPEVRVVLASGYSHEDVAARFAGKSLSGVLQKPYTLANLRESLAGLLPKRQAGEG